MTEPIRILRILNRFNLGGPTYNVVNLSAYIGDEFNTRLIGGICESTEVDSLHIAEEAGIAVTQISSMRRSINPFQDILTIWKIIRIIREFKPQIVHTHAAKAGITGRIAAVLCRVPVIIHTYHGHVFSGYFTGLKNTIVKTIERVLCLWSTACITISKIQKHQIVVDHKIGPDHKFHVIPLGFNLAPFRNVPVEIQEAYKTVCGIQSTDFVLSIIGRMAPIKQHAVFVEAVHLAQQQLPNISIKAVLVGDGELRSDLETQIQTYNKTHASKGSSTVKEASFIFTSWEPNASEPISVSHCVCLSSANEGTPVSLIEAQAASKPVISTRVGGVEDIVQEDKNAMLCNDSNPHTFAAAIVRMIENYAEFEQHAKDFAPIVNDQYSYTTLCDSMRKLYIELLKKKGLYA